ncbi:MAG: putative branched-chain amino acid transporter permease protein [Ilumatobacteraceae bacterium]|nr:putative branched-chain amino acid transporter permease protein [Ilumatobacteraceae bacterium]
MAVTPIALREGSTGHRAYVRGAWALAALVILYPPLSAELGLTLGSVDKASRIGQLNAVVAFAVAILGLEIVTGYSGQLALGQSAFVGLGAYTTVILVADHHWSFYAAVPATIVVCFMAGLLVGIPATRVKGVYLAIVTLVLAFVFPSIVLRFGWLTGGPNGKGPPRTQGKLLPPSWTPLADAGRLAGPLWVYCISIVLATAAFVLARNVVRSRPGRALITMRDHEPAAVALGVNTALYKAMTFGLSAVYGGLAGSMLMMNRPFATDALFDMKMSIFLVAGLVIGGTGAISGAIPGALAYVFVPYYLTTWAFDQRGLPPGIRQVTRPLFVLMRPAGGDAGGGIFFGLALVVLTFVLPGGVVSGLRRLRGRVVTIIPHPWWLPVRRGAPRPDDLHPDHDLHRDHGPILILPTDAPLRLPARPAAIERTPPAHAPIAFGNPGAAGDPAGEADDPDAIWRR